MPQYHLRPNPALSTATSQLNFQTLAPHFQTMATTAAQPPSPASSPYMASANLRLDLNPQSYLYAPSEGPDSAKKYRSIVDFIPKGARQMAEEPDEHEMAPGVVLTMSGRRKINLILLHQAQWVASIACILVDSIKKNGQPADEFLVVDYMSYT